MDPASIAVAVMLAAAPPSAKDVQERATPIRCRPAPYYIAERVGKPTPRTLLDTPEGGRPVAVFDKRGRPCHLTRTPNQGRTTFHNAD